MGYTLLYGISCALISIGIGWFIAIARLHHQNLLQEVERVNLVQGLQATRQALVDEQNIRKQAEFAMRESEREQRNLFGRLTATEERVISLDYFRQECEKLNQELCLQREINRNQEIELREITIRLDENRLAMEEKQRLLINSEQRLSVQFENLANRIFEHSGRKVDEQNRQSLDRLLIPLHEQLEGFRRQVQDSFGQDARERHTLVHEIHNLQHLNTQMVQETINLTRALKGDNKTQGNWGEVVLNKVLEASGLREGHEFETQISIHKSDGRRLQPDVVVRLPKGKDVIIDAKISLVAYERYFNSSNDTECKLALTEHINSLRTHIKLLGSKDYHQLPGLQSLDYVLLFVPIEPAFMVAISHEPELISEALVHNVMLVSPTTLLVALRTINNLWRYEHQSRNAQDIADRAARLYDKLRLFVDDINAIGQSLDKAKENYRLAKNKLSDGRGNIIRQAEGFRSLGVEIKRPITSTPNISAPFSDFSSNATDSMTNLPIVSTLQKNIRDET
ncbi:DNA recombination protein RmuC [Candidatus Gullanella endobia]|uniref:DNA recombination protein RmuC n=1 Tax=Candidatus Gullanella endobia TaxID=1070130 RepID=A0A143WR06_9ENTR|nr:DNA recombination protein RmuC [Candidatus Gullanella endobia]CUX96174.1 DNA recombination protein RmuC [Candidatus Gullanella endobia]